MRRDGLRVAGSAALRPGSEDWPDSAGKFHVHAVKQKELRDANRNDGERAEALTQDRGALAKPEEEQARRRQDQRSGQ